MTKTNSVNEYFIGYANEMKVRFMASSGGVGTAIQAFLLSTGEYGCSITFVFDKKKQMYSPRLIFSKDEINICGSIYQDVDIVHFVKDNITKIKRGIVLSCAPCQVMPIRLILKKHNIPNFIISFCCSGQTTIEGTWKYYKLLGIQKEDIVNMQYRGNGWPSGIQIMLKDGKKIFRSNYSEPWASLHRSWFYRPRRCFFCKLDGGINADVSLADPWLDVYKKEDKIGNTMLVAYSEKALSILRDMVTDKKITLKGSNIDEYNQAQFYNVRKKVFVEENLDFLKNYYHIIHNKWYFRFMTYNLFTIKINNKLKSKLLRIIQQHHK